MPATTIDEVIAALTDIISDCRARGSRLGYFPALYRRVTQSVKDGVEHGQFQNGPLLEKLDVAFANRYLDAYHTFQSGGQPTRSWAVAFHTASDSLPLILQQLLVGISAHINLDLGVATAAVAPGDQFPGIKTDFDQINSVLGSLVGVVADELAAVSPEIGRLEKLGLRTETKFINFDIDVARQVAWSHAERLAVTPPDQLDAAIAVLDLEVAAFNEIVAHPGPLIDVALAPIRIEERDTVQQVIDVLVAPQLAAGA